MGVARSGHSLPHTILDVTPYSPTVSILEGQFLLFFDVKTHAVTLFLALSLISVCIFYALYHYNFYLHEHCSWSMEFRGIFYNSPNHSVIIFSRFWNGKEGFRIADSSSYHRIEFLPWRVMNNYIILYHGSKTTVDAQSHVEPWNKDQKMQRRV